MTRTQHTRLSTGRRVALTLVFFGASAALLACSDTTPTSQRTDIAPSAEEVTAQHLARGFALALAIPEVRVAVRDAMRASLWDEHKLSLGDFVGTPAGIALLTAAARARGVSLATVEAELARLPALDFYMPIRAHRRAWTGDANLVVVAAWEGVGDVPGFAPDGRTLSVSRRMSKAFPALFFIQPAEWKGRRVRPQASVPGLVVEDANDGEGSEMFVWRWSKSDSVVIDFADADASARMAELTAQIARRAARGDAGWSIMEICDPTYQVCDCDPSVFYCEQPPPPPPPPPSGPRDTTRVFRFVHYMADHGWSDEAGEFRFDVHLRPAPLVLADAYGSYYKAGLEPLIAHFLQAPVIFRRMVQFSADWMDATITEEDRGEPFGFNPDDYCGTKRLTWQSNNVKLIHENTNPSGADNHCNGGDWGQTYALEVTYQWTPTSSY
ncbi:MAG TPA: hypothetical protein VJ650_08655 [Gemmatimonadaceae bacterium]|nr:hypothetical protein [Gemmatimonadaceae bacterium]